jgi:hypothetical protein
MNEKAYTPKKGRPTPKRDETRAKKRERRIADLAPLMARWPAWMPGRR